MSPDCTLSTNERIMNNEHLRTSILQKYSWCGRIRRRGVEI
ncbi:MAG: hypothetical protein ABGZ35_06615 [Planctomycetaceae bacterium]